MTDDGSLDASRSRDVRRRRRARSRADAEAAAVEVSLRRARLVRCSRRSAGCPGIASPAPSSALLDRHAPAIVARDLCPTPSTDAADRRARVRQRREDRDPRRSAAGVGPPRPRAPDRHLAAGAGAVRAHARPPAPHLRRRPPRDLRGRPAAGGGARATRDNPDARAAARIQHRQLRHAGRARIPARDPRRARARRRAAARRRPGEAGGASCSSPTTIRSASPRRSTATCSSASTASSAARSISTPSRTSRSGTRRTSRVEMHLESRAAQRVTIAGGRVASTSRRASASGPRARTSTSRRRSTRWGWRRDSSTTEQWIDDDARFALTLLTAG